MCHDDVILSLFIYLFLPCLTSPFSLFSFLGTLQRQVYFSLSSVVFFPLPPSLTVETEDLWLIFSHSNLKYMPGQKYRAEGP